MNPPSLPISVRSESFERDDEIDLVEVLGFLYQLRFVILAGALAGLLLGIGYAQFFVKRTFQSKVSVTLDVSALPAITDSKKVVEAYQGALGSPELAAVAFRKILANAPEFAKNLSKRGVSLNDLVSLQTLGDKPADAPLRLMPSTSVQDFVLQANFSEEGLGRKAGEFLLDAVNEAAREYNSRALRIHDESAKNMVQQATLALKAAQSTGEDDGQSREKELNQIQSELAQLEYQLGKAGRAFPAFERFVYAPSSLPRILLPTLPQDNAEGANGKSSAQVQGSAGVVDGLDVNRGIRMVAALEEEGKLTADQAKDFRLKLVKLQSRYLKESSLHSTVSSASRWALAGLYDSMARSAVPIDRSNLFLPLFRFNSDLYTDDLADRSFESPSSKARLVIVGFLFFGTFGGFALGALRIFVLKNQMKFRSYSQAGKGPAQNEK